MNKEHPELIVCAAIKFELKTPIKERNGTSGFEYVLPMVRHYDSNTCETLSMLDDYYTEHEREQGFITNQGRFVNRKEALEIAKANNQIRFDIGYEPDELYSEMLY
ncbi:hypothetical protein MUU45_001177 [Rodentibacter pneumotropicus]|uniref:Uncharacterized protein n=1 Tax=Rodentibacter pneumotropicus TaxID=758 RepID=A0AAW5LDZ9_9PAST|nr:hypothetical protein [Rodentibacter pneumotropicus]MCQ9121626.1 hypothetical protein [Rodentibacter pneumotropicus]